MTNKRAAKKELRRKKHIAEQRAKMARLREQASRRMSESEVAVEKERDKVSAPDSYKDFEPRKSTYWVFRVMLVLMVLNLFVGLFGASVLTSIPVQNHLTLQAQARENGFRYTSIKKYLPDEKIVDTYGTWNVKSYYPTVNSDGGKYGKGYYDNTEKYAMTPYSIKDSVVNGQWQGLIAVGLLAALQVWYSLVKKRLKDTKWDMKRTKVTRGLFILNWVLAVTYVFMLIVPGII